jgi:hypothetical protein
MKSPRDHALALLKKASNDLVAAKATVATGKAFDYELRGLTEEEIDTVRVRVE